MYDKNKYHIFDYPAVSVRRAETREGGREKGKGEGGRGKGEGSEEEGKSKRIYLDARQKKGVDHIYGDTRVVSFQLIYNLEIIQ